MTRSDANTKTSKMASLPANGNSVDSSLNIDILKKLLLKKQHELLSHLETVRRARKESTSTNYADPTDKSAADLNVQIRIGNEDTCKKLLEEVFNALERIEDDDYGYCETCGESIGFKRLKAHPETPQCVDCKSEDEKKEQSHGGNKWTKRQLWSS